MRWYESTWFKEWLRLARNSVEVNQRISYAAENSYGYLPTGRSKLIPIFYKR